MPGQRTVIVANNQRGVDYHGQIDDSQQLNSNTFEKMTKYDH